MKYLDDLPISGHEHIYWKIAAEKATLAEWNVPLKNGGDNLLQKYDYFSFLRKDFPDLCKRLHKSGESLRKKY